MSCPYPGSLGRCFGRLCSFFSAALKCLYYLQLLSFLHWSWPSVNILETSFVLRCSGTTDPLYDLLCKEHQGTEQLRATGSNRACSFHAENCRGELLWYCFFPELIFLYAVWHSQMLDDNELQLPVIHMTMRVNKQYSTAYCQHFSDIVSTFHHVYKFLSMYVHRMFNTL